jgi:transcription elongation factor SPT4
MSGRGGADVNVDDRGDVELDMAEVPDELKALRACKGCGLIKTFTQFVEGGCENCPGLNMQEGSERVHECTSSYFTGFISLIEPPGSWVAKWLRSSQVKPGVYAIDVVGELPAQDQEALRESGLTWKCRPAQR